MALKIKQQRNKLLPGFVFDGSRGPWGRKEMCPNSQIAVGFSVKVQAHQGEWIDDSGMNAIMLHCQGGRSITSQQARQCFGANICSLICSNYVQILCVVKLPMPEDRGPPKGSRAEAQE